MKSNFYVYVIGFLFVVVVGGSCVVGWFRKKNAEFFVLYALFFMAPPYAIYHSFV